MPQRMTAQTMLILEQFLEDPDKDWYGLELMDATKLKSGTVYPITHRLREDNWLSSARENIDPEKEGRPPRRLYRLTALGQREAVAAIERRTQQAYRQAAPPLRPRGATI